MQTPIINPTQEAGIVARCSDALSGGEAFCLTAVPSQARMAEERPRVSMLLPVPAGDVVVDDWGCVGPYRGPRKLHVPCVVYTFSICIVLGETMLTNHACTGRGSLSLAYATALGGSKPTADVRIAAEFGPELVRFLRSRQRKPCDEVATFIMQTHISSDRSLAGEFHSVPRATRQGTRLTDGLIDDVFARYVVDVVRPEHGRISVALMAHKQPVDYSQRRVHVLRWRRDFLDDHQRNGKTHESRFNVGRYKQVCVGDLTYNAPNQSHTRSGEPSWAASWAIVRSVTYFRDFDDVYNALKESVAPNRSRVDIKIYTHIIRWDAEALDALRSTLCLLTGAAAQQVTVLAPALTVVVKIALSGTAEATADAVIMRTLCELLRVNPRAIHVRTTQASGPSGRAAVILIMLVARLSDAAIRQAVRLSISPRWMQRVVDVRALVTAPAGFHISACVARLPLVTAATIAARLDGAASSAQSVLGVSAHTLIATAVQPTIEEMRELFYGLYSDIYSLEQWQARFARTDPKRIVVWHLERLVNDPGVHLFPLAPPLESRSTPMASSAGAAGPSPSESSALPMARIRLCVRLRSAVRAWRRRHTPLPPVLAATSPSSRAGSKQRCKEVAQQAAKQASQIFYVCTRDNTAIVFVHDRIKNNKCFVPGGHQEPFDVDVRHTAWREGREETGITVPLSALVQSWQGEGTDGDPWILTDFAVCLRSGVMPLLHCAEPTKHRNGRWLTLAQIGELDVERMHDTQLVARTAAAIEAVRHLTPVAPVTNATALRAAVKIQREHHFRQYMATIDNSQPERAPQGAAPFAEIEVAPEPQNSDSKPTSSERIQQDHTSLREMARAAAAYEQEQREWEEAQARHAQRCAQRAARRRKPNQQSAESSANPRV